MNIISHEIEYRSKELIKKMANQPIIICGCGAIGSNLTDNIVRQGFQNICSIDMDRIETKNIGSQIWEKREAGNFKVRRMKERVYAISGQSLKTVEKKLDKNNISKLLGDRSSIIIDAFDNTESRTLLYDFCKNGTCLHIGLYQDYAEIIWNEYYTVPKGKKGLNVCEYPLARNIVLLSVIVASEVLIQFINTGEKNNYTITLKDLKIRKMGDI